MKLLQFKEFSQAEQNQLSNLSFCAGGNLRKSASRARNRLRYKQSEIYTHNFKIKLKNFCIKLQHGICDESIYDYSRCLNLAKNLSDEINYETNHIELWQQKQCVKMFIQNYLPFKYLKMYHHNMNLITN